MAPSLALHEERDGRRRRGLGARVHDGDQQREHRDEAGANHACDRIEGTGASTTCRASPMSRTCARSVASCWAAAVTGRPTTAADVTPSHVAGCQATSGTRARRRTPMSRRICCGGSSRPGECSMPDVRRASSSKRCDELDVDAEGIDASRWAISHAARSVAPYVRRADLTKRLPFPSDSFDVVAVARDARARSAPTSQPRPRGAAHACAAGGSSRPSRHSVRTRAGRRAGSRERCATTASPTSIPSVRLRRPRRGSRPRPRREGQPPRGPRHDRVVPVVDPAVRGRGLRALRGDRATSPSAHRTVRPHARVVPLRAAHSGDVDRTDRHP